MELQNCVIVDGVRSPFTRGGRGAFVATRLDEVAVTVLQTLLERNSALSPYDIEDLGLGNVGGVADVSSILKSQSDNDENQISSSYLRIQGFVWEPA